MLFINRNLFPIFFIMVLKNSLSGLTFCFFMLYLIEGFAMISVLKKYYRKKVIENKALIDFREFLDFYYSKHLVDEYTDGVLKTLFNGNKVKMIVGKRYSIHGLEILAEAKKVFNENLKFIVF